MTERPEERLVKALDRVTPTKYSAIEWTEARDLLPIARAMAEVVKDLRAYKRVGTSFPKTVDAALQALDSLGEEG